MLEITDLIKAYGNAEILHGISLAFDAGTVTGIAGPNGAGKSTLVKVICGETAATGGSVAIDGVALSQDELSRKTAIVHQEPQLFPTLTVAENVVIGHDRSTLHRPSPSAADLELLDSLGLLALKDTPVREVPIAAQQRTEIARALSRDARIVLFDEPNSALTEQESEELFLQMRALAAQGRVVLLVTHRLQELVRVADRVITIKDGQVGAVLEGDDVTEPNVARQLADASLDSELARPRQDVRGAGPAALALEHWRHSGGAFSVDRMVGRAGEVLAVVGVEGSGARQLTRSIGGFEKVQPGSRMRWDGVEVNPGESCGFVPASRQESVFATLSVGECLVSRLPRIEVATRGGLLRPSRATAIARDLIVAYDIRCRGPRQPVSELSGGNQQKVVLASAVAADPRILAIEEPTRGVDVGSRTEIYDFLRRFAASGHGVVLFCTELTEVLEAADRVFVLSRGRVVGEVEIRSDLSLGELAETVAALESAEAPV